MRKTCLNMVYELAKQDERVVFVGSDLGPGVLEEMKQTMPDRYIWKACLSRRAWLRWSRHLG